ncbi:Hypothetical protein R9X50_00455800 [Acrodontium crateriforme]|uniref:F-box domain-containing protein n=1 Tax=Acrodontium crateriforme TaxID=150365 RepID=A0AAQ3M867_9PEZI|nr:Hypothetical protein R9X50_00455800 [Acrodontium crateriforme]
MAEKLSDLASEVLDSIVAQIDDVKSLRSLAQTSRRLQHITEPYIYRHAFVRTGHECYNLLRAFNGRSERALMLRSIDARFQSAKDDSMGNLTHVVQAALRLNDLTIESPYCNRGRWRRADGWKTTMESLLSPLWEASYLAPEPASGTSRPLQALRKLVLHLNGEPSEFWNLQHRPYSAIFAHPTLEDVHISSANILDEGLSDIPDTVRIPLKRLTIDECNITIKAFERLMMLPKALEYLYLGESQFCEDEEPHVESMCHEPKEFFAALAHQKSSLQTFIYEPCDEWFRISHFTIPNFPVLADFKALRELRLNGRQHWLEHGLKEPTCLPPNLTSLHLPAGTIFDDEILRSLHDKLDDPEALPPWLEKALPLYAHLKKLDMTWDANHHPTSELRELVWTERTVTRVHKRGIRMRVFQFSPVAEHQRPILYGEDEPVRFMLCSPGSGYVGMPRNLRPWEGAADSDSEWEDSQSDWDDDVLDALDDIDDYNDDDDDDDGSSFGGEDEYGELATQFHG